MAQPKAAQGRLDWISELPLILLAFGAASSAMMVPAVHATVIEDFRVARAFFYTGTLGMILFTLICVAMSNRTIDRGPLAPLLSLFGIMTALPILLALPFYEALRTTTFLNAYMEMVSSITTTGATMFDDPERLPDTLHLWRAQVGWMGGFVMWAAAAVVLAPLNLGGFEITARAEPGRTTFLSNRLGRADTRSRLIRAIKALFPIYAGLTLVLWIMLLIAGNASLTALCHAMSILATSGISPTGGLEGAEGTATGEIVMWLFLIFAVSRLTFSTDTVTSTGEGIHTDPEIKLAAILIVVVPLALFLRHWLGAFDVQETDSLDKAVRALWGAVFTVTSFLTTTGFTSADWATSQDWSGLGTPGIIFMGLALVGGGVATTAGGVKLLRMFALYRHGVRELQQLVHPSSVSGARGLGRRLQQQGAYIAWVFLMLFAVSLAALCLALAAFGAGFEEAMILAVAGLSNTGPLLDVAGAEPILLSQLSLGAKITFGTAMVVGRLEILAIIALATPDLWRG